MDLRANERRGDAGDGFDPAEGPNAPDNKLSVRILRALATEGRQLRPRQQIALAAARALPQFSLNRVRTAILRSAKIQIGEGSLIMGELYLSGKGDWLELFSVGSNTFISGPLRVNLGASVRIGNGVNIGHDVLLLTVDHEIGPHWRRAGWSRHAPIAIADGVWIGARTTVLPGVTINKGSVVAAGAIVTHDVPAHTLVGGVPAKVLRTLDPPDT